jgi:microcystin-dependent protein
VGRGKLKRVLCLLFLFFSFTVIVFSDVPNEIRYNGRLKSYNYPANGNLAFNFKIYDISEGGTALWESGNQNIILSSGIFTYIIKPNESMVDWRKKDLWLQIVVDGRELLPREKITAQPYAFHSYSCENLSSNNEIKIEIGGNTAYIGLDGNSLYYKSGQRAEKECLGVPPGTVIAFAGNNGPKGYLLCDGKEVDVSRYPDLFRAIGTIYGGNGTSKFKLPDFRGMFLRGTGGNAAPLGQQQGDAIRNITGDASPSWAGDVTPQATGVFSGSYKNRSREATSNNNGWNLNFDASRVVPVANENRPVNYAVNYYIKY